jgi:HAE1 family hydrophobic/amphiphilic exporter-1
VPQVEVNLDRDKVQVLGIPLSDIFSTMQAQLGSLYVNDFNKFGRIYRVLLQAETAFRDNPDDIGRLSVRSADGNMVQLSTLSSVSSTLGPERLTRFHMFRSATLNGSAAAGVSSGEALTEMEALATRVMPQGMAFEWSVLSLQEKQTGSQGHLILGRALWCVYLFLVAHYESWTIPWAVILVVPVALLGALVATLIAQLSVDLYVQVALIILVGLSTKQAILIVEFAKNLREVDHLPILEAATSAARLRFRSVMMTAWSFILGVLPLVVATGAGANARRSLGTSILGGMIAAAVLGTLLTPAFLVLMQHLRERPTDSRQPEDSQAQTAKGEATA